MEMMKNIRIKCPNCGAILTVTDNPANAGKNVRCPNCGIRSKYEEFRRIAESEKYDDSTEVCGKKSGENSEEKTEVSPGKLLDETTGRSYELKEGLNLVGRMTYKSPPKASLPILTEDMGMSRAHFYIHVMLGKDGLYHSYIYNASNKNATFINAEELQSPDKVGLKDGDVISVSRTKLKFVKSAKPAKPFTASANQDDSDL